MLNHRTFILSEWRHKNNLFPQPGFKPTNTAFITYDFYIQNNNKIKIFIFKKPKLVHSQLADSFYTIVNHLK